MKQLSIEEKAYNDNYKVYIELINRLEDVKDAIKKQNYGIAMDILCKPNPEFQITTSTELKESEDDNIRRWIINEIKIKHHNLDEDNVDFVDKAIAWLEKQGEQSNWKPSKDEMDALYGLAYITNKMDDKKDKAITKLYQDLKMEFFNNASYENMFPSSPVDSGIFLVRAQKGE